MAVATENEYMEEGRPVPEKTIMEVTLINNRTDKMVTIKSGNQFGLELVLRPTRLSFFQKFEKENSEPQGFFTDWSVIKTVWK